MHGRPASPKRRLTSSLVAVRTIAPIEREEAIAGDRRIAREGPDGT